MRSLCTAFAAVLLLAAGAALADPPRFACGYNIDQVEATNTDWLVSGLVSDASAAGFDGEDVPGSGLLVTETIYGDCDLYTYALVTATVSRATILATYAGTNAAPRIGTVTLGGAWLCEDAAGAGIPLGALFAASGPAPYLRDVMLREALARLAAAGGGAGTGDIEAVTVSGGILTGGATSGSADVALTTNALNAAVTNTPALGGVAAAYYQTAAAAAATYLSIAAGANASNRVVTLEGLTNLVYGSVDFGQTANLTAGAVVTCGSQTNISPGTYFVWGSAYQFNDVYSLSERLSACQIRLNGVYGVPAYINEQRIDPYPGGTQGGGLAIPGRIVQIGSVTDVVSIIIRIETDSTTDAFTAMGWFRL